MPSGDSPRWTPPRPGAWLWRWLPDVGDRRYPRPGWFALLRTTARCWWLLGVCYLAAVLTNGLVLAVHQGLPALWNRRHLASAALLDRVLPVVERQPWLIAPLLVSLALLFGSGRWAQADHARESKVLALRVLRAPTPTRLARGVGYFALRWLWHRSLQLVLLVGAVLAGVAVALLGVPPAGPPR